MNTNLQVIENKDNAKKQFERRPTCDHTFFFLLGYFGSI